MNTILDFAATTGNDETAARFVGHFLAPIFDTPYAIDSRKIDGLWVHLLHDAPEDETAVRAQRAADWRRARGDEDPEEWDL